MTRKFKSKKRINLPKTFKWIIIFIIIIYVLKYFKISLLNISVPKTDERFIKYILDDYNYYSSGNKDNDNIFNFFLVYLKNNFITNPKQILSNNFNYKINENQEVAVVNDITESEPLVYIYNSHPGETYSLEYMEDYNINPNVQMVSYIFKENLDAIGINTIVEDADISKYLKENDMQYYQSYEASRFYLNKAMKRYNNVLLYLDIHRDAIDHKNSTVEIDGKNYAKIMFVVGLEHDNYQKNLENANYLNDLIKSKYPDITRGVLKKEGKNVNGIYNQDLSSNIMLMEIGGNYNNISEVLNTVSLVTPIIGEYINEKKQEIK